jgi:hypothetical protein
VECAALFHPTSTVGRKSGAPSAILRAVRALSRLGRGLPHGPDRWKALRFSTLLTTHIVRVNDHSRSTGPATRGRARTPSYRENWGALAFVRDGAMVVVSFGGHSKTPPAVRAKAEWRGGTFPVDGAKRAERMPGTMDNFSNEISLCRI